MMEPIFGLRLWLIAAVVACSLSFSSCLKDDNHYSVQAAGVALINASPGSPALDFISDNRPNLLEAPFAYDTVFSYNTAYPGYRLFGVTLHNSIHYLASEQFYLEPGVAYSLFVTDTAKDIKLVMLKDSLSHHDSSKATIRFANMSADAPALGLTISGGETATVIPNTAYPKATKFQTVDPKTGYTLKLTDTESGSTLATKTGVNLEEGKIYTIWAKGFYEGTDPKTKLDIGLMVNE